jgi:membrane-associated phospholipid phosphatase
MNTKLIAKIISYQFIPPVMNVIIFILFAIKIEQSDKMLLVILSSLVFGLILPIIIIVILRMKGKLSNNDATIKEERTIPYLYAIGFSLLGTSLLYFGGASTFPITLWVAYFLNSSIIIVINKFWKISAHTLGVAIPLGASFVLSGAWIVVFGVILLIVAWARYELKVHTITQLIAGAFVGFIITYLVLQMSF